MSQDSQMLKSALWYGKKGFSVIPIKGDKRPYLSWEKYQRERASEDQIKQWWTTDYKGANVGIVTGSISGLTVVDTDSDEGLATLLPFLDSTPSTPLAKTPKGNHFYFSYADGIGNKGRFLKDCDVRSEGGYVVAPPSIIGGKKYEWAKDHSISSTPLAPLPPALRNLLQNSNNAFSLYRGDNIPDNEVTTSRQQVTTSDNISIGEGVRDQALFHLANHLVRGGMPEKDIRFYLEFFARRCDPPFPDREIEAKIKSAMSRENARDRNLTKEIRDLVLTTSGNITTTFVYNRQQVTTREEKKKVAIILHRLEKEGLLEQTGRIAGEYRRVEKEFEAVDIMQVEEGELFDIRLPFAMHNLIDVFPKDLIVFAGVPNAGKTAVMLETVKINQHAHRCFYFSSEMGRHNCKQRIGKSADCRIWNFKFVDDFKSFVDVIQPDDLNFVDYVEVPDGEYYKIPSILAGIQHKLRKGVAIVALQKNPDKKGKDGRVPHAIGGAQTLAKPAVFCTIDPDYPGAVMRIEKAKNYKDKNPNGYAMKFKIHSGINLEPKGVWKPEIAED
jgi:hypothetical protein